MLSFLEKRNRILVCSVSILNNSNTEITCIQFVVTNFGQISMPINLLCKQFIQTVLV